MICAQLALYILVDHSGGLLNNTTKLQRESVLKGNPRHIYHQHTSICKMLTLSENNIVLPVQIE